MISCSLLPLFQSKYKGSDDIERIRATTVITTLDITGGKEWVLSKESDHTLFGVNMKVIYTGVSEPLLLILKPALPGETVFDEANALRFKILITSALMQDLA
jgi:hypothetical protein